MTVPTCPNCRTSATWSWPRGMTSDSGRWKCAGCGRPVDGPRPPVVSIGQGEYAKEIK